MRGLRLATVLTTPPPVHGELLRRACSCMRIGISIYLSQALLLKGPSSVPRVRRTLMLLLLLLHLVLQCREVVVLRHHVVVLLRLSHAVQGRAEPRTQRGLD